MPIKQKLTSSSIFTSGFSIVLYIKCDTRVIGKDSTKSCVPVAVKSICTVIIIKNKYNGNVFFFSNCFLYLKTIIASMIKSTTQNKNIALGAAPIEPIISPVGAYVLSKGNIDKITTIAMIVVKIPNFLDSIFILYIGLFEKLFIIAKL